MLFNNATWRKSSYIDVDNDSETNNLALLLLKDCYLEKIWYKRCNCLQSVIVNDVHSASAYQCTMHQFNGSSSNSHHRNLFLKFVIL